MKDLFENLYTHISTEAIDFQISSKLGSSLDKLFQSVIDYRDDLLKNQGYEWTKELCNALYSYAKKIKMEKQLKEIIKREANLEIQMVELPLSFSAQISGLFACIPTNLIEGAHLKIFDITAGKFSINDVKNKSVTSAIEEFMKYTDNAIDQSTGTLKKGKLIETAYLVMDFNLAFLSEVFVLWEGSHARTSDIMKSQGLSSTTQMTAREITSIILHELGHTYTILERASQLYYQFMTTNEIIKYKEKYDDHLDTIKHFKENKNKFLSYIQQCDKSIQPMLTKAHSVVYNAIEALSKLDMSNYVVSMVTLLAVLLISNVSIYLALAILACRMLHISFMVLEPELVHASSDKTSDTKISRRNWFHHEREADNFAIAHGYGTDLAEALRKLIALMRSFPNVSIGIGPYSFNIPSYLGMLPNIISKNVVLNVVLRIIGFVSVPLSFISLLFAGEENIIYESGILTEYNKRIDRILENFLKVFKDPKIPNSLKDHYLSEITRLKNSKKKLTSNTIFSSIVNLKIDKIIKFIFLIPTTKFMSMVASGHLTQDYANLQNQLDSLMNNELFYQAHRFDKLLRS
jgi:cell fate (sporulation/competence/biofilm development) regulator YlbF (YheA/YmcA/DUF963 family)